MENFKPFLMFRRGLKAPEAAHYIGVCTSTFRDLVAQSRMPKPRAINSCKVWDVEELDAAFKSLPLDGANQESDTWADFEPK